MATTKAILAKIKLEGEIKDLIAKSNGENVAVNYNGKNETLSEALAEILASINALPTSEGVINTVTTEIAKVVDGAPESFDTLKEIATYIEEHQEVVDTLNAAIGNKVDKVEGKGLSTEDFTTALKNKLDNLPVISAEDVESWNNKATKDVATTTTAGLMSAADKTRLDGIRGVRVGSTVPDDMQDGELFVQLVSE